MSLLSYCCTKVLRLISILIHEVINESTDSLGTNANTNVWLYGIFCLTIYTLKDIPQIIHLIPIAVYVKASFVCGKVLCQKTTTIP